MTVPVAERILVRPRWDGRNHRKPRRIEVLVLPVVQEEDDRDGGVRTRGSTGSC